MIKQTTRYSSRYFFKSCVSKLDCFKTYLAAQMLLPRWDYITWWASSTGCAGLGSCQILWIPTDGRKRASKNVAVDTPACKGTHVNSHSTTAPQWSRGTRRNLLCHLLPVKLFLELLSSCVLQGIVMSLSHMRILECSSEVGASLKQPCRDSATCHTDWDFLW